MATASVPTLGQMAFEVGRLLSQHRGAMIWAELITFKDPGFARARDELEAQGDVLQATFNRLKDLAVIGDAAVETFISSRLGPS